VTETQHIVNKIAVKTSGISTENAFNWRAQVAAYLNDEFPHQLQLILDELYHPGEQVSINRLEVNISLAKPGGTGAFQRELLQALRNALYRQKQETALLKLQDGAQSAAVSLTRPLDAWLFYLQKGYYPWFHQQVLKRDALELLFEENAETIADRLPGILKSPQAQQRFLMESRGKIGLLLLPYFVVTKTTESFFLKLPAVEPGREEQIQRAKRVLLNAIVTGERLEEDQFIKRMDMITFPRQQDGENKSAAIPTAVSLKSLQLNNQGGEEKKDAVIWIQNAGLILLYPFLPVLFDRLLVTNEHKQIEDITKALSLIHYLLYAEKDYSDASMVLPKILCGIPYNDPIAVAHPVNGDEQKECEELLLSVIEYWDALKSTSITGLLETFVWRKGKLDSTANGWLLRVENRSEDILLDRLPWSISNIKLPWMTAPLTTEWRL
jgi:hypothetical protein